MSVHCSLVVTCFDMAGLLALLFAMFYCVFVTFPCGVLGQVWCLIVSIFDLCLFFTSNQPTLLRSKSFSLVTLLSSSIARRRVKCKIYDGSHLKTYL